FDTEAAVRAGLVTFAPDDIDWQDEIRLAVEERAAMSPDALTGMEANLRFPGPETLETKIFGRLSAWQNWIFTRPNATGEKGALRLRPHARLPVGHLPRRAGGRSPDRLRRRLRQASVARGARRASHDAPPPDRHPGGHGARLRRAAASSRRERAVALRPPEPLPGERRGGPPPVGDGLPSSHVLRPRRA